MPVPSSTDPNQTSGRAAASIVSYTFPLLETPTMKTRLRFMKYSRLSPSVLPTLETSAIVTLPLPMSLPDTVMATIKSEELGWQGNINIQQAATAYNNAGGGAAGITAAGQQILQQGQSAYSDYIKGLGGANGFMKAIHDMAVAPKIMDSDFGRIAQKNLGVIQNPHTNAFFEGMSLRTFSLSWQFSPRSQQEAEMLTKIKNLIKQRITPEESLNGYALDYPDLVEIDILGDSAKHLTKIHRSFITKFSATPRGGSTMSFYNDGAPSEQEFSMDLTELNIVTRNKLQEDENE
ncbi:baseplate tail tube cap protein [Rhizobium phage RHph_I1_18]|nr:baseplate tail tube cap protein [Rhizobium phage RHph_I1_18]